MMLPNPSRNGLTSKRMSYNLNDDPVYQAWRDAYPGKTDDGKESPIELVAPGIFVHSMPFGYMPAESEEEAKEAWAWKWVNQATTTV